MINGVSDTRENEDKRRYNYRELLIYTKWLRWSLYYNGRTDLDDNQKESFIKEGLVSFCEQLQMNFNRELDYYVIENLIEASKKYKIRDCNKSYITKSEWFKIKEIPDENARKLYFAMLILGKYNRNNPVKYVKEKSFNYTDTRFRLKMPLQDIYNYIGLGLKSKTKKNNPEKYYAPIKCLIDMKLVETGTLEYMLKHGELYILNFADVIHNDIKQEDVYEVITNYNCIKEYYRHCNKEKDYKICKRCGAAFKSSLYDTCGQCIIRKPINKRYESKLKAIDKYSSSDIYSFCSECGKRFRVDSQKYTFMCDECYKVYRDNSKRTRFIKTKCTNCQEELEISENSKKTPLCNKCKLEKRREQWRKSDAKKRLKKKLENNSQNPLDKNDKI